MAVFYLKTPTFAVMIRVLKTVVLSVLMTITSSQNATRLTLETLEDVISSGFECMEGEFSIIITEGNDNDTQCNLTSLSSAASLPPSFPDDFRLLPGNLWYPNSSGSFSLTKVTRPANELVGRVVQVALRYYCSNSTYSEGRDACCYVEMFYENGFSDMQILPSSRDSQWTDTTVTVYPNRISPFKKLQIRIPNNEAPCHGVFQSISITVRDENCTINSDCPPGLSCQKQPFSLSSICRCADRLNTVENHRIQTCNPILGAHCYIMSNHSEYFPCAGRNAVCDNRNSSDMSIGTCSCSNNYKIDAATSYSATECKLAYGQSCSSATDCLGGLAMGCINDVCSCTDRHLVFRGDDLGCVATEGNLYGMLGSQNGNQVNVGCDVGFTCLEETDKQNIRRCSVVPAS